MASEGLQVKNDDAGENATAFLVDLVSNRKIPITSPRCKVGRDDLNDIVISGDQSISRFHFVITKENGQYMVQDGKSRHGTFLNGNQIITPEPIHDGDVLKVGVSLFWFVIEATANLAGSEKFAPVDIELIDQELEFMSPDAEPADAERAVPSAQPVSSGQPVQSGNATQELSALSETTIAQVEAAIAGKKKLSGPGEATAAIPTLPDNFVLGESLFAPSKHVSEAAPTPEPTATTAKPEVPELAQPEGSTAPQSPENDEITVAMLLDPLHKETAAKAAKSKAKSAASADPEKTLVNLEALKLVESEPAKSAESEPAQPSDTLGNLPAMEAEKGSAERTQEAPAEPILNNFTDFISGPESKFTDYQYSTDDSLTKEPVSSVLEERSSPTAELVQPEPITDSSVATPTESSAATPTESSSAQPESGSPAEQQGNATTAMDNLFGSNGADEMPEVADEQPVESTIVESSTPDAPDSGTEQIHIEAPTTLGKFAEIIGEASSPTEKKTEDSTSLKSVLNFQSADKAEGEPSRQPDSSESAQSQAEPQTNGAKGMSIVKEGASTVPDWCKRYFGTELNQLSKELGELNEQVRLAQQKIKDVEGRVALTKGLRNTLLTAQGEELVEACGKVLTMLGWKVKVSDEDKHELRLDTNDEKGISIARIVWTETQADRTHLGQLSISQTRFWCEQGVEPKGILVVSKAGDTSPPTLSQTDRDSELAEYATKKNVCLMTTLQLLSVYKDIALGEGNAEKVRGIILDSSGWLSGYNLEPGNEPIEKEEGSSGGGTNKLSSLLSA